MSYPCLCLDTVAERRTVAAVIRKRLHQVTTTATILLTCESACVCDDATEHDMSGSFQIPEVRHYPPAAAEAHGVTVVTRGSARCSEFRRPSLSPCNVALSQLAVRQAVGSQS